jgi:hypothetical protein
MSVLSQSTTSLLSPRRRALGVLLKAGLLGGATAAVANLVLYAVARALFAVSFIIPDMAAPGQTMSLPIPMIAIASVGPALLAALLLWLLGRFFVRPLRIFQGISAVLLLLSLAPPMTLEADLATRIVLTLMHVVAAAAIVGALSASQR